jgi:hypothetical protein
MPTLNREQPVAAPERELVPDSVLKALVQELEHRVAERDLAPERRSEPAREERTRYNHD